MKRKLFTKKVVKTLALFMTLAMAFTACGAPSMSESTDASEETVAEEVAVEESVTEIAEVAGGTLTIASSAGWTKDVDQALAEAFTAETGIEVEFILTPDDQYTNVLKSQFATGEGPDIFLVKAGVGMNEYQPTENFLTLSDEAWVERQVDWAVAGTTYEGEVMALNLWSADGWGLLYNPEMFAEAGIESVPTNYEELSDACDKLMEIGVTPIYECGSSAWHLALWLNAVAGTAADTDADYLSKLSNNEMKFSDVPAYETAMEQLQEMAQNGYFGENFMAATWENAVTEMASGEYAMILAYSTFQNEVVAADAESGADSWEMFSVPLADNDQFAVSAGGVIQAINKNSPNIELAKQYFEFRTREENVVTNYEERPELGASAFVEYEGNLSKAYETVLSSSIGTTPDLEGGIPYFDTSALGPYVQELLMGTATAAETLSNMDAERQKTFDVVE